MGTSFLDNLARVADEPQLSPEAQALTDWVESVNRSYAAQAKLQAARDEADAAIQAQDEAWEAYKASH